MSIPKGGNPSQIFRDIHQENASMGELNHDTNHKWHSKAQKTEGKHQKNPTQKGGTPLKIFTEIKIIRIPLMQTCTHTPMARFASLEAQEKEETE